MSFTHYQPVPVDEYARIEREQGSGAQYCVIELSEGYNAYCLEVGNTVYIPDSTFEHWLNWRARRDT